MFTTVFYESNIFFSNIEGESKMEKHYSRIIS